MLRKIYFSIFLFCRLSYQSRSDDYDIVYFDGIRSLSELPLEQLLAIKSSFISNPVISNQSLGLDRIEGRTFLQDLDLGHFKKDYPIKRFEESDDRNSKITKIFNLTISALSFLAFGGYLITLIISAIKQHSNSTTSSPTSVIVLSKFTRPKRKVAIYDGDFFYNPDKLYEGMIMLSQDFAKLN